MNHSEINTIALAVERAIEQNKGNWNPVYANVINADGDKVGHIVSDGYTTHSEWTFYPVAELRKPSRRDGDSYQKIRAAEGVKGLHRANKRKHLLEVIPKWVGNYTIKNVRTYKESNADA